MDSNKYRRGTGTKYKNSSLNVGESLEFLGRINKRGERKCLMCAKNFISPGAHIHKCPKCKLKESFTEKTGHIREPLIYRTHAKGIRSTAFHAEVGE